jgi:isocitrate dehydrogenase
MMLAQNGQAPVAARIEAAWLRTLEDGIHTLDIFAADRSKACVGTQGFAEAVIARLGQQPRQFDLRLSHPLPTVPPSPTRQPKAEKTMDGVDLFLHWSGGTPDDLADAVQTIAQAAPGLRLAVITNRGVKVWPKGRDETFCTDHWRCRFMAAPGVTVSPALVPGLLQALAKAGLPAIKMEMLFRFDGTPGYTAAQGQ